MRLRIPARSWRTGGFPWQHAAHTIGANPMCLTCGCMDAHLEMGKSNIRYEDVKKAADENGKKPAAKKCTKKRTPAKKS